MKDLSNQKPPIYRKDRRTGPGSLRRQPSFYFPLSAMATKTNQEEIRSTITGIAMQDPTLRRARLKKRVSFANETYLLPSQLRSCQTKLNMDVDILTTSFSAELKIVPKSTIKSVLRKQSNVTPSFSMTKKCHAHGTTVPSVELSITPILPYAPPVPTQCVPTALDFSKVSVSPCVQNVFNFP